ncbi:MAG: hypothetical protein JKY14_13455 [Paraglaciecola sp.]|nr:hypothetical protein [Paraglaciecola sp.]
MHSFSDQSGCTFLHPTSGETLSVKLTELELIELFSSYKNSTTPEQSMLIITSLVNKGFIEL